MNRTMVMHVRFETLYICYPASTKQQREMTVDALISHLAWASLKTYRHTEQIYTDVTFEGEI